VDRQDAEIRFPLPKTLEVVPHNRTENRAGARMGYRAFLCIVKQQLRTCVCHEKPVTIERVGGIQANRNILDTGPGVEDRKTGPSRLPW